MKRIKRYLRKLIFNLTGFHYTYYEEFGYGTWSRKNNGKSHKTKETSCSK